MLSKRYSAGLDKFLLIGVKLTCKTLRITIQSKILHVLIGGTVQSINSTFLKVLFSHGKYRFSVVGTAFMWRGWHGCVSWKD